MPIFEYKCSDCSKGFEILQLPGHGADPRCPYCGGANLKKLISAPFLPSSVGRPANDDLKPCGTSSGKECPEGGECSTPGSCCGQPVH